MSAAPPSQPVAAAAAVKPLQTMRPLNVRDALSYLDDVKQQFSTQPEVYNKFLEIMKDFKMQLINTPGVIDRVSNLFQGHPSLIQGFNTFLPPGYRVDCSANPNDVNVITITTPTGVTTRQQPPLGSITLQERLASVAAPAASELTSAPPTTTTAYAGYKSTQPQATPDLQPVKPAIKETQPERPAAPPSTQANGLHLSQLPAPSEPLNVPAPPNPAANSSVATPGAASILGIQNPAKPPIEFNHAISYVNKIKTRFSGEPSTYKTFLEILQTYQKEARPIQDVYAQVTQLFATAPDLLEEFKQFLPDPALSDRPAAPVRPPNGPPWPGYTSSYPAGPVQPMEKKASQQIGRKRPRATGSPGPSSSATLTAAAQGQEDKRRKRVNQPIAPPLPVQPPRKTRKTLPISPAHSPPLGSNLAHAAQSPYPRGSHGLPGQTLVSIEELGFFDRAKRHIADKATYQEFLKLLNLFTQEQLDLPGLVEKAWLFLGADEDLFAEFKTLVGWDQTEHGLVDGEEWIIDNVDALERPRLDLNALKGYGPSYKRLPAAEVDLACSGRDALCWSVLNDEWVAHATWASEGAGAHRKNLSEEALMYSEQERHWFSITLQTNSRAIATLDPIEHRINLMDAEQQAYFRLRPGFNKTNTSVVERAIKRVYGSDALGAASGTRQDHAKEIIRCMYETPAQAIPIILSRLRQKDEDWTRALREWNKVWREVDTRNYYRSLDHQALSFKINDKKAIATRNLVAEIQQLRKDQKRKRHADYLEPAGDAPLQASHFQFEIAAEDKSIIFDVMRLVFAYLERNQGGVSAPERQRVEGFIRLFVPMISGITTEEIRTALGHFEVKQHEEDLEEPESDADQASDTGTSADDDRSMASVASSTGRRRPGPKAIAADLRRRLLSQTIDKMVPATTTNGTLHEPASIAEHTRTLGKPQIWVHADIEPWRQSDHGFGVSKQPTKASVIDSKLEFFANNTFYSLVRVFYMLYHRLRALKLAAENAAKNHKIERLSPLAVELGMAQPLPIIDIATNEGDAPEKAYYQHMLDLCERLFDGDVEASNFEESVRLMWGIKAFPLFSVDKLVATVVKHTHTINADAACQDIMLLIERSRQQKTTTLREQMAYRMEVEGLLIEEDHIYRMEWVPKENVLAIQLLGPSDLTVEDHGDSEDARFEYYVSSYALSSLTEGVTREVNAPLLKRNHRLVAEAEPSVRGYSNAQIRFNPKTLKLFHVGSTGDEICRQGEAAFRDDEIQSIADVRKLRFNTWLQTALVDDAMDTS